MRQGIFFAFIIAVVIAGHNKEEWRSRTIYQILTDRFSRTSGNSEGYNLKDYCGGTFRGIINNLKYIQGMGFDAIWISPVVDNTNKGYHGYWARNWNKINSHFGTEEDLKALVTECHKKGIWVMVDVVANHVGPVWMDYSSIYPFNKAEHYHKYCKIRDEDWRNNQWRVENCRLADLPDLSQENSYVADQLCNWVKN